MEGEQDTADISTVESLAQRDGNDELRAQTAESGGAEEEKSAEANVGVRRSDTHGEEEEGKHAEADVSTVEPLVESESETDGEECGQTMGTRKGASTGVVHSKRGRKPGKRRYVWCPIKGCLSGPIKKLTQHLYRVHNLPPSTVAHLNTPKNRRGMYAPLDAVENRTPCPAQKQRTLEPLQHRHYQNSLP